MNNRIMMFLLPFFVLFFYSSFGFGNEVVRKGISKEKAILIANEKVIALGYDISRMKVIVDENKTIWNNFLSTPLGFEESSEIKEIKDLLKNKIYWVIYYEPTGKQFGGDVFVIVERFTGEILFTLPLK
jgi:hypothetical protein